MSRMLQLQWLNFNVAFLYIFRRNIHPETVRRRLRNTGMLARRPHQSIPLTPRHKLKRLRWARCHLRYTQRQWGKVLFSDESKFNVSRADGRHRVYRRNGERYTDQCVMPRDRWGGGGSVHVWGGISKFHKTRLVVFDRNVNANTYIQNVLQPVVVPFMRQHFRGRGQFQQDNAPAHNARLTTNFLQRNNINVMNWPAKSPDMSPIENLWDELGRRVYQRRPPPATVLQLRRAIEDEWNNMPQRTVMTLFESMRRRCRACINANGSYTKY